jgi:hypothetical protein
MIRYVFSGICLVSGAGLAYSDHSGWPWFLAAGVVMFFLACGTEMRINEKQARRQDWQ